MPFSLPAITPESLKSEAHAMREEAAKHGESLSHAAALERVARAHGYRDWNTAAAAFSEPVACPVAPGQKVSGVYLKQPFTGTVLATAVLPGAQHFQLTIHFDQPVDVVAFESFSAMRRRVNCTVNAYGVSPKFTSDGEPHLRLDLPHR